MDPLAARSIAPDNYAGSPQKPQPSPVHHQPPASPSTPYGRANGAATQAGPSQPQQHQYQYPQQPYQNDQHQSYQQQPPYQQHPLSHLQETGASPTRPPKFTEEWDATPRGSSIMMDGPMSATSMQRPNSFVGSVTGDSAAMLSRSNTLKKRA